MTPAKLKRLRRVLDALKQTDMARLANLRGQQQAADDRAAAHRVKARMTYPVVDATDMKAQTAWTRAELRRADAEDMAREALSAPIAEAAAQLAQTFGREAALKALSEKLDREQARADERKQEAALSWMQTGARKTIAGPRPQDQPPLLEGPGPGTSTEGGSDAGRGAAGLVFELLLDRRRIGLGHPAPEIDIGATLGTERAVPLGRCRFADRAGGRLGWRRGLGHRGSVLMVRSAIYSKVGPCAATARITHPARNYGACAVWAPRVPSQQGAVLRRFQAHLRSALSHACVTCEETARHRTGTQITIIRRKITGDAIY